MEREKLFALVLAGGVGYALWRARQAKPLAAAPSPTYAAQAYLQTPGSPAARSIMAPPPQEGGDAAAEWAARTKVRDLAATTTFLRNLMWAAVTRYGKEPTYFLQSAATKLTALGVPTLVVMGARTAATLAGPLAPVKGAAG